MMKYLTTCINFDTHQEAEAYFEKLRPELALSNNVHVNLMADGSATINLLTDKPLYVGQNEYKMI